MTVPAIVDAPHIRPVLRFDGGFGWRKLEQAGHVLWFKGFEQTRKPDELLRAIIAAAGDRCRLESFLSSLDGFYALVIVGPDWCLAAVDRVRSMPIVWARRGRDLFVTQDGPRLANELALGPRDTDPDATAAFSLAGFTIGSDTLYRDVHDLLPGTYLVVSGSCADVLAYHQWRPWLPEKSAESGDLARQLSALHERLIDKLIASAGGREISVPLSAGLDSRMILSGLVAAGYANVRAFAYGLDGNREAVVSKMIAERLGVPWHFVPFTNRIIREVAHTPDHQRFVAYADSLTSIHFPQDYPALRHLLDKRVISEDAIVVNGQSGDFITGNHIPPQLGTPAYQLSREERKSRIIDALVGKHFKQWSSLLTDERLSRIRRRLSDEIDAVGGMPESPDADHGIYEYSEFIDRQSKYVIHGQRCYEYLGLGWRLPLWDRDYLDFWEKAPLGVKRSQRLYREVLMQDNWSGVWRDIPVNPLRVRPRWLVPVRLLTKVLHAPLGHKRWRAFEKRYLGYWMTPLCSYGLWRWRDVAYDKRGHVTAIAWHAAEYLKKKGLRWDGEPPAAYE